MTSAGMPELLSEQDILYLRDCLWLDESPALAQDKLQEEIKKSLSTFYRRFDNWVGLINSFSASASIW